jgi:hypothetical protein
MSNKPKALSDTEVRNVVKTAITEAVDYVESEISPDREKAMRYYSGKCDIGSEQGRSRIVSTKIRDTIRQIKPSLMRVFLQAEHPVEFIGSNPQQAQAADNASEYCKIIFNKNGGYKLLQDVFHDSLLCKNGIAKVYYDPEESQEIIEYANLSEQEMAMVASNPEFEILEHTSVEEIDEQGMQSAKHDLKVVKTTETGTIRMESVPPEQFFIDPSASCISDSYVVGQRQEVTVGDLIAMGFEWDEVSELDNLDGRSEQEQFERINYDDDRDGIDPANRPVLLTECYMKVDVEGAGMPQPYKFLMGGTNYKLLSYEPWDDVPFISFCQDPIPHAFFGQSIADVLFAEQDSATVVLRGILDNTALVNNPRVQVLDGSTNIDDLMNNEIGGIVRVKQPGAIQPMTVPFVAADTLQALQYLDRNCEGKTGVSAASAGLSADSLKAGTSATSAQAMVQANTATLELIARNLAEGGVTALFKRLLKLVIENMSDEQMMRISGTDYVQFAAGQWDPDMDVQVNVGLGTGNEQQKLAALQQGLMAQEKIISQFGLMNGIVGPKEIVNTVADMLRLAGVQNADRYFQPVDEQKEQQLMQMAQQQSQQQQPDPNAGLVQAEQVKAQAQMQIKQAEMQQRQQLEAAKMQQQQQADMQQLQARFAQDALDRDLKRDELDAKIALEAAALENKAAFDEAALYQKMQAPRTAQ